MPWSRDDRNAIVYIGGYGRSGSTVLEILLADRVGGFASGELTSLLAWSADDRPCSCGRNLNVCPFWGTILERYSADQAALGGDAALTDSVERNRAVDSGAWSRYETLWGGFISQVFQAVEPQNTILDSSKCAGARYRALRLAQLGETHGWRLAFIHMTRDPRAVAFSASQGGNYALEGLVASRRQGLRAAIRSGAGWTRANFAAWRIRRQLGPDASVVVRYEDLCRNPDAELNRLLEELDLNRSGSHQSTTLHAVGGNRIRRDSGAIPQVVEDRRWKSEMSLPWRLTFSVLVPLRWLFES